MSTLSLHFFILIFFPLIPSLYGQAAQAQLSDSEMHTVENPMSVAYLQKHLAKKSPKLFLTPSVEKNLKQKLQSDPLVQGYYQYLKKEADLIRKQPLLKRELEGFRMLAVSRNMIERMSILCMVYRIEKDPEILQRIDEELKAVCNFSDWNPQHFLDIAEMAFGVALAIDWVGEALPAATVEMAKTSLIEKGIEPSFNEGGERMGWINGKNNWNAVCHGGMIAASLVIADVNPELAAKTIGRALDKIPNSFKEYGPDGVYPEGPMYWAYGTYYSVIASSVFTTALGQDFGLSGHPGFMESAHFRVLATAPSGEFFNFADSDGKRDGQGAVLLSWFAAQTGDALYFDQEFFENPTDAGRFAGLGLVWLSAFTEKKKSELPQAWYGQGRNPVAFFRGGEEEEGQFYLAVKGGTASASHGNMDAGTFVFELDGIRWILDPGNQPYYPLNRIGFNLAGGCQDCERWTLLTKNNQGHSTVTVNNARFNVKGYAPITDFKTGEQPEVSIDMSEIYEGHLTASHRRFVKESKRSILIEDQFELNDSTDLITWGLMTVADVLPVKNGAILRQDGKELKLSILAPEAVKISIISLDPPPLAIDKTIDNLKRIEIRLPAYLFPNKEGAIQVRLSGE